MMSDSWHTYPSVYSLGHRYLTDLLLDPVLVEEKIDGSQISFGRFDGELRIRSKGADIQPLAPEKMFKPAVDVIRSLDLTPGWTYRGEYLAKPKHNALAYDRVPRNHLILFDINTEHETYCTWEEKAAEASRLGLEVVPRLHHGLLDDITQFQRFLSFVPVLGGQTVEGVVVKNYARFGMDKKVLMGKYVSEAFKEVHAAEWKSANPGQGDVIQSLIHQYRTPARWSKAAQHLREAGLLADEPKDIGLLFKEAPRDLLAECEAEIRDTLFAWAWPKIQRGALAGMAEWYKEQLLARQFGGGQ